MFGGHQRSMYKYPSPDAVRSLHGVPRRLQDRSNPVKLDSQSVMTRDHQPQEEHALFPTFASDQPEVELSRPRSANSHHKPDPTITANQDGIPPMPDLQNRLIHIPMRTSSNRHERFDGSPGTPASGQRSPSRRHSLASSAETYDTEATSMLPPLQTKGPPDEADTLEPLLEDDPRSYNLVAPAEEASRLFSLEIRAELLFSRRHLEIIFADPSLLLKFTTYLSSARPRSVPILMYYLEATKALRAINYANAVAESLEPIDGHEFTACAPRSTVNAVLEEKANKAFDVLVREDLPAYITHIYTQVVSISIQRRITGTLPPHLREASEGLAEVFCLTDPSRPDNPIVFASEEFHRTTQYGMSYVIGRNCRFLQGPKTNQHSVRRLRDSTMSGRECSEVFLNYRRDGSPFMNLLMTAPLTDSRGQIRYFIGAQVDVSGIAKDCTDLESLRRLVNEQVSREDGRDGNEHRNGQRPKTEFQDLSEMLNQQELEIVRRTGGRMHRDSQDDEADTKSLQWHRPRLLLADASPDLSKNYRPGARVSGKLSGVYQNYLLIRPYPSLRILFASPSLRVPGILQSQFMHKIGGSSRVREELTQALAEGRGVTAKVRWLSKADEEGRNRWIHCTPLLGSNGQIGVWMVVLVDDEIKGARRYREAPPVSTEAREQRRGYFQPEYHEQQSGVAESAPMSYRSPPPVVNTYNDYAEPMVAPRGHSTDSVNLE